MAETLMYPGVRWPGVVAEKKGNTERIKFYKQGLRSGVQNKTEWAAYICRP